MKNIVASMPKLPVAHIRRRSSLASKFRHRRSQRHFRFPSSFFLNSASSTLSPPVSRTIPATAVLFYALYSNLIGRFSVLFFLCPPCPLTGAISGVLQVTVHRSMSQSPIMLAVTTRLSNPIKAMVCSPSSRTPHASLYHKADQGLERNSPQPHHFAAPTRSGPESSCITHLYP